MCLRWTITERFAAPDAMACPSAQIARTFHHTRRKIRQVLAESEPTPYTRTNERPAPVLGPFHTVIDQILTDDEHAPPKQRHTAMQVFRRLRDEHGYPGGYGQVQRYLRRHRSPTSRNLHPSGTPPRPAPRSRFRAHPRRLPRRPTPGPLPRHHLGLFQRPLRPGAALRAHRGDPRRHGRRVRLLRVRPQGSLVGQSQERWRR